MNNLENKQQSFLDNSEKALLAIFNSALINNKDTQAIANNKIISTNNTSIIKKKVKKTALKLNDLQLDTILLAKINKIKRLAGEQQAIKYLEGYLEYKNGTFDRLLVG